MFFGLVLVTVVVAGILVTGEAVLRLFSPTEYLYPRYRYSPKYGFELFDNTRMIHARPGTYEFHYTVNRFGYRGPAIAPSTRATTGTIVLLGDSYTFGMGVNDGEEYGAILGRVLEGRYQVVNLGIPGWGLTQEIRRYYDFGILYHPEIVVLQFCSNDPEDNFNNMVTRVADGGFEFIDSRGGINWTKKYLSRSIIQKSQLYNFFRNRVYLFFRGLSVRKKEKTYAVGADASGVSKREAFYSELLERFAAKLREDGTSLVMIAVNRQLDRYPNIKKKVLDLDRSGVINYVEVEPWFDGVTNYGSKEGHHWGAVAHRIIAEALADSIEAGRLRPASPQQP